MSNIYIIGEIGINHNGDLEITKQLIDMAKECGCNAVKFQKRDIGTVYTKELLDAPRESPWGTTQREQKEGLEFDRGDYIQIDAYCQKIGIEWFASSWDLTSQIFLREFNLPHNKIASAMLTNEELVQAVINEGRHTFISTGMSVEDQIDTVVGQFELHKVPYTLLHCVSIYPCPNDMCNLDRINTLLNRYSSGEYFKGVGYSGHERGHIPSVIAVVLGATVIERHITLDRAMYGSDQAASIEWGQIKRLCRDCRNVKAMIKGNLTSIKEAEALVAKKLRYWE